MFLRCDTWQKGPEFISHPEQNWPHTTYELKELPPKFAEFKSKSSTVGFVTNIPSIINKTFICHPSIILFKKSVVWLLHLKSFLRAKIAQINARFHSSRSHELQYAEPKLIKHVQTKELSSIISDLNTNLSLKNSSQFLHKLSPILVDGFFVWEVDKKCAGRLLHQISYYSSQHLSLYCTINSASPSSGRPFRYGTRAGFRPIRPNWAPR